jgi:hypothetical protein
MWYAAVSGAHAQWGGGDFPCNMLTCVDAALAGLCPLYVPHTDSWRTQNSDGIPDAFEDGTLTSDEIRANPQSQIFLKNLARNIAQQHGVPASQVRSAVGAVVRQDVSRIEGRHEG